MSEKVPVRVLDAIAAEPWAITEEGLRQIISIAMREADVEAVEARFGKPLDNTRTVTVRDGVAIIPVTGPIFRYANLFTRVSGATSIEDLATDFTTANDDPTVRAIVLTMDTPGGTAHGPSEFARLLHGRAGTKPVVAYGGGAYVASAGLWIAAAADERVSSQTTYWGSLGALISAARPKDGAGQDYQFVYARSPKKRVDLESDDGKAQIQAWVDDLGDVFVANVAEFMGISEEKVLADFGQGDLLIASKALAAGMIDRIATLEEVIDELSTKTRTGTYVSPRLAAKSNAPTPSAKEKNMEGNPTPNAGGSRALEDGRPDLTAQMEAMRKENEALVARLDTEARTRVVAEVEAFKTPLLAKDDLRFNAQTVAAYGNLLLVAKCAAAGLTTAKIPAATIAGAEVAEREVALDARSLGAFVAEQVKVLTDASARFEPPADPLAPGKPKTTATLTRADFEAADRGDAAAGEKIDAAVRAKIGSDIAKYSAAFNELRTQALAAA